MQFRMEGDKKLMVYLDSLGKNIKSEIDKSLNQIADHLQDKVKDKFGTYQQGWPTLKRASVIAKYRRRSLSSVGRGRVGSYTVGSDDPLILFGKLRDSIEKEVNSTSNEAIVFSDNEYSAVHEYGYKNVPSRSYMRLTLAQEEDEIHKIININIGKRI